MKTLFSALTLALLLSFGAAHADVKTDCEAKAIGKNGKKLAGAAKNAFIKKCEKDAAAPTAEAKPAADVKPIAAKK